MHFMQNRTVTQRKGNLHFFLRTIVLRLTAEGLLPFSLTSIPLFYTQLAGGWALNSSFFRS